LTSGKPKKGARKGGDKKTSNGENGTDVFQKCDKNVGAHVVASENRRRKKRSKV